MTEFTPSAAQAAAIAEVRDWFENRTDTQQVFRLFGYAGSGKSTVLKFALDELGLSPHRRAKDGTCVPGVVTATFTGKAALVLTRKGTPARTIHSLIYSVIEATEAEIEAAAQKVREAETAARRLTGFDRTTAEAAIEAMRQALSAMKHPRFALNPPELSALSSLLGRLALARLDPLPERQILARIKTATGISMSILDKQLTELRRRVHATGDPQGRIARPAWFGRLCQDLSGTPERNEANVIIALSSDPVFAGLLAFDEFAQSIVVRQPLPWDDPAIRFPRPWDDADDVRTAEWLQLRGLNVAPMVVGRGVGAVARDLRIHPVRDWLDTLKWDGTPRIETWTSTYLGAAPTAFHHTIGALWLISAVARIYRPGVKADHMLILEGPQGARKSTAIKVLAGEDWFTDELPELGSKDAAIHMQGVWIVEIAELDAIGRAEVSRIKAFLTRTTDRFRPPYGRYTVEVPRQCVFAGTVNPDTYLRDETGNRRFWPLRCGSIDIAALARDRDQIWAEAVHRFREGAIWWLDDPALLAEAAAAQEARYQADAWDARIDRWLTHDTRSVNRGHAGWDDWQDEEFERPEPIHDVSVGEILEGALGIEPAKWTKGDQMRVGAWLKSRDWERYRSGAGATREWRYRRLQHG